jgi:hypothetical protein
MIFYKLLKQFGLIETYSIEGLTSISNFFEMFQNRIDTSQKRGLRDYFPSQKKKYKGGFQNYSFWCSRKMRFFDKNYHNLKVKGEIIEDREGCSISISIYSFTTSTLIFNISLLLVFVTLSILTLVEPSKDNYESLPPSLFILFIGLCFSFIPVLGSFYQLKKYRKEIVELFKVDKKKGSQKK